MDPEQIAIMEALRRLGAVPHQRDINVAPRSEPYMDALSEADPRDMSANEQFVMRNAPVIPEYTGHDEMDPNEMEPDNDADDYGVAPTGVRMVKEYGGDYRGNPSQYERMGGFTSPPADPNPAMLALRRMRGGR